MTPIYVMRVSFDLRINKSIFFTSFCLNLFLRDFDLRTGLPTPDEYDIY